VRIKGAEQMTNETMPWPIWLDAVLAESGVSMDDYLPFRQRVSRWYAAGESYTMAGEGLAFMVKENARQERISKYDDGMAFLRKAYRASKP
jgi:hypothetical protein